MLSTANNLELSSKTPAAGVSTEFEALVSACGFYDLGSRAKLKLTGSDRVRWLNGMVTNNIRDLAAGHGVYAFLLNPQGRILADLYAYNRGDSLWLDVEQSQLAKILEIFDHYIIMDDVEVENVSDKLTAIGLSGPNSADVLRALGLQVPDLRPLESSEQEWEQTGLTVIRGDQERRNSYEIWLATEKAPALRTALSHGGATPVGAEALELHRIALGIPRYGQDIRERDLPQETEQARALNFSKGCYIGQEIVERIRSRGAVHRTFTGFLFEKLPAVGSKIQANAKDIGEITSAAALPLAGGIQPVALGYIRREAGSPGNEVVAGGLKATVTGLPFKVAFA
jgi:folate-binding protein YgfZ